MLPQGLAMAGADEGVGSALMRGASNMGAFLAGLADPGLRIGVTGLSRAGKTVFLTGLVHNLLENGRLPALRAFSEGRIVSARLAPQPDDDVPRFAYEDHLATLTGPDRDWPDSTRQIAQLRVELAFETARGPFGLPLLSGGRRQLALDLIDYPGEWLIDLVLLGKDYAAWSRLAMAAAEAPGRRGAFEKFLNLVKPLSGTEAASEGAARALADAFTEGLQAARGLGGALASLPPGRFLMPGDLAGSPALTFAPLPLAEGAAPAAGSLAGMMARRYESYKTFVVRPFFRDHFARLDRQIVLVDLLAALNAGAGALRDLETAMTEVLTAFNVGANDWFSTVFSPRADRVLFVATKADHLHHSQHDRLEAILSVLTRRAIARARAGGASVGAMAIASVRATREVTVSQGKSALACIAGVPVAGQILDGKIFDGREETALFPGELPERPEDVFDDNHRTPLHFLRFRPPLPQREKGGRASLPHIRLDRVLEFLIGDRLA